MLTELRIRHLAVIDEVGFELDRGLTVLSGETGAGKTIVVEALSLLLGERASSDLVRAGESRARVEGAFDVSDRSDFLARCREGGVEVEQGLLLLARELRREGRSRAWVNGNLATAGLIRELGAELVDLHGQHEHQRLLSRAAQRRILDAYAGAEELVGRVAERCARLEVSRRAIEAIRQRVTEVRERAEFLRFKLREIETAEIAPGEEERLIAEVRRLEHSEELTALSSELLESVYEGEGSVVDALGGLRRPLDELGRIDPDVVELEELYLSALHPLEELGRVLGRYRDSVEHDPGRLTQLRARLDTLYRLKGRYGPELSDVLESADVARHELEILDGGDSEIGRREREAETLTSEVEDRAAELTSARVAAAARLESAMNTLLPELGMEAGRFEVAFEELGELSASGRERIEFRVSLNPGFDVAPLSRVSSGGEMSRLMLALKTALSQVDEVPCLVFDEIDAGVGGEVAHRVAERLARLAESRQVFVVTHLPQIAARADTHLLVEKAETDGRAVTRVRALEGAERVRELARMLGGDPESARSRSHAEEMLTTAG